MGIIMNIAEIIDEKKRRELPRKVTIGIDIGSRQSKAVLINGEALYTCLIPTGFSMTKTAQSLLENLLEQSGLSLRNIDYIVTTGYGRIAVRFDEIPNKIVTEISCHGLGGYFLGDGIKTIVDIGGQDSKVIKIDPANGRVVDFVMNDKCAAGTGRFLEKAANLLGLDVEDIGETALRAVHPSAISSQCVVFSESEIISGRARGENVSDIAAGVHKSVAKRVQNLLSRVGIEENVLFTGGVSNNIGMKKALEDILGFPIQESKLNTVFAGALGAAVYAGQSAVQEEEYRREEGRSFQLDLSDLTNAVERTKENFMKRETGKKKNVAYLCAYTPQEILSAANVAHIRMMHAGTSKEVVAGEVITQSIFCDFTKSCLGALAEKNPLYESLDKIYTFYTCDCMKKATEAINDQFVPAIVFNLPRLTHGENSKIYFAEELRGFVKDLEKLTGEEIDENEIRKNIALYNEAKALLRKISSYRKEADPLFGSTEFQQIANSYYYLPVEELIAHLRKIDKQLEEAARSDKKVVRLMLAGGIVAEGDTKAVRIIERELGARIVVEDNCSGYSPFAKSIEEKNADVFEDIAEGYLGKAPCARMKPLRERIMHAARLAQEYQVDGVIYYYLKFCPCYGLPKNEFVKEFQKLNLPVLEMPVDYSSGDEGQLRTRVEAFIEVLAERS